jgi:hypothetical protein
MQMLVQEGNFVNKGQRPWEEKVMSQPTRNKVKNNLALSFLLFFSD